MSRRELLSHQRAAVKDILNELQVADRATLVSATGTGKTVSLQHIAEVSGNRIVAFFPSIMLVSQTIEEWKKQYKGKIRVVAVCSDTTVGKTGNEDVIEVSDDELRAEGAEVTRDPVRLAEILAEEPTVPLVVFSTYHSADKIIEAQELCKVYFDLLVSDEAHYLAGLSALGRGILDSKKLLAKKRVFATATPKLITLKQSAGVVAKSIVSMDDEKLFGRQAHKYGLRDAISDEVLSDYKIYIVSVTKDTLYNLTGKSELKPAELRMALGLAAYERMKIDLGVERSVVYLSSKVRAREFASSAGSDVTAITGEMPSEDRNKKLNDLRVSGGGIANVRCLTEGVDLPALDAVEFVDPRSSKIDIVQAVGRALRRAPGKEFGYVILPVLEEPNGDDYGSGDTFKAVWSVLAQMAENDTALSNEITGGGYKGGGNEASYIDGEDSIINISLDGDKTVANRIANALVDSIKLRAADINEPWEVRAAALKQDFDKSGRLPLKGESNYHFLIAQRSAKRAGGGYGKVWTKQREDYMNKNIPGWYDSLHKDVYWQGRVQELKKVFSDLGRGPKYGEPEYSFYDTQRSAKNGKGSGAPNWTEARQKYLDEHIPGWDLYSGVSAAQERWEIKVQELKQSVVDVGRFPVKGEGGYNFWNVQKSAKRGLPGLFWNKEREDYMDKHVPGWDVSLDSKWEENVFELIQVVLEFGRLPKSNEPKGVFLNTQRYAKKSGKLTQEREDYLNKYVSGWNDSVDSKWEDSVLELLAVVIKFGRLPKQTEEKGTFLANQKRAKNGTSRAKWSKEREDFLNLHIPGWDLPAAEYRAKYLESVRKQLEDQ